MSVEVKLEILSQEQQKNIDKLLTFMPEEHPSKKFTSSKKFNFSQNPSLSVKMYISENRKVYLPYRFSCAYFKQIFNQEKAFPTIFDDKKGKFSGKLLPRQEAPFKEAIHYLQKFKTVTIALYPGFGKTFLGTMISWYINLKTCVLVHRDNVGKQWVKTFQRYFDLPDSDVCWVDNKKINSEAKIFICMDGRVDKIPKEVRDQIGCLIIDEAHCFCSPSKVKPMLSFSPKYIIAETATPVKDNGMHKVIQSICGTHYIRKISNKPYHFYLIQTNLEFHTQGEGNVFGDLVNQQCQDPVRNQLIVDILEANQDYKAIVATARTEHCRLLKELLGEKGLETSELYGNKKNYKTRNILIGTGSKMGVGFDEANFCDDFDGRASDLLIMSYSFASWAPFEQVRGRGMRAEHPNVVMFNDQHNITKKHFRQIKKWVKETNGQLHLIQYDKIESYKLEDLRKKI